MFSHRLIALIACKRARPFALCTRLSVHVDEWGTIFGQVVRHIHLLVHFNTLSNATSAHFAPQRQTSFSLLHHQSLVPLKSIGLCKQRA